MYAGMWRNHQNQSVCGIHLRQFYSFFFLISQFLRKEVLHFFFRLTEHKLFATRCFHKFIKCFLYAFTCGNSLFNLFLHFLL